MKQFPSTLHWIVSPPFVPAETVMCPGLLGTLAVANNAPEDVTTSTVSAQVEGVALTVIVSVFPEPLEEIESFVRPVPLHAHGMMMLLPRIPGLFA